MTSLLLHLLHEAKFDCYPLAQTFIYFRVITIIMYYSPSRLPLTIPDSPVLEKQAFRSRSFRRVLFSACALSLLLAILRSIHVQNELHRKFSLDYLSLYHNGADALSQQRIEDARISEATSEHSTGNTSPQEIKKLMNQLPELIRIPFEDAVEDVNIEGWEDDWFSSATYDFDRSMDEPRLDFVYNCAYTK